MLKSIKQKLIILCQNAQQEFYKTPIQSSATLGVALFVLLQAILSLWAKDSSSNRLIRFLLPTIEINLLLIILSVGLLVLASINLLRLKKLQRDDFKFVDYDSFAWKIINPTSPNIFVEDMPYCPTHKVQYVKDEQGLFCPLCMNIRIIDDAHVTFAHKSITSIVQAKFNKHIQNENKRR